MLNKFAFVIILFYGFIAWSQTPEELLASGLKSYHDGQFEESKTAFKEALTMKPDEPSLLYNLGLAEYRSGQIGLAIGVWRKALTSHPQHELSKEALEFALSKLEKKEVTRQVVLYETLRASLLSQVSLNQTLAFFGLTLLSFGVSLFGYLGSRKRAQQAETPPPAPGLRPLALGAVFIFSLTLVTLKTWDQLRTRATVVPKVLEVRAGPETSFTTLFELYEGLEVVIEDSQNGWKRITYPGGRSGWAPSEALFQTVGKSAE